MDQIETMEKQLGRPVVASNQATLWAALRFLAVPTQGQRAGRLFELPVEEAAAVPAMT
jgi:maleate cis-trans isomerase